MSQVTPLRLTPDSPKLLANTELLRLSAELSEIYASKDKLVTDGALQVIGKMLWQSLDAGSAFEEALRSSGQGVLPLIIESNEPVVHQLPWETLYHPECKFLGRHEGFTLTRSISSNGTWLPPVETGPLRVLLFTSLPDDLTEHNQLQIEEEQAQVLEALGQKRQSGHVVLGMPDDGRFSTFKTMLKEFEPHLVWLSGHGVFKKNLLDGTGTGHFLFEGADGNGELVDESALAEAFSGTVVQALVLSACQSGKAVSTNLNNGLMFRLAARGVPHVIAMRESIYDRAGVQFARAFFAALLHEKGIGFALQQGRDAISRPFEQDERFRDSPLAALSFGQWCLPAMLSHEHDRVLIDWHFTPQPMRRKNIRNKTLKEISLPEKFIGRRRELRSLQRNLRSGSTTALLITGAGGIGKTALAGKLIQGLQHDGYEVFVFSARTDKDWKKSIAQMERSLIKENAEQYSRESHEEDAESKSESLLELLHIQYNGKVALLFDNLESVQEPTSRMLTDAELNIWIDAAAALQQDGLRLVLTSRWALPGWENDVRSLGKPVYRDFLAVAQQMKLPSKLLGDYDRLRKVYEVLGGNFRAVEFFAGAIKEMNVEEEQAFLQALAGVQEEIQADMALDTIWKYRSEEERELLRRMTAYTVPIAPEGVKAIALPDIPEAEVLLDALLSVSLVERYHNPRWKTDEFLVSPLVRSWLDKEGVEKPELKRLQKAAGYHKWLLEHERQTLDQAITTHAALMASGEDDEAHRIALDGMSGPMSTAGLYQSFLNGWLFLACTSSDPRILSKALNQIGKQYIHLADYDTALEYLKRSLSISEELEDKSAQCSALNNIATVYHLRGDYERALEYYHRSLIIAMEIGDKDGESIALGNVSSIYKAQNDHDTAMEYLRRSMMISQEIGNRKVESGSLNKIATHFYSQGDYETALEYLKQSLMKKQEIGDKNGEGSILNNISLIYKKRGNYDLSLEYLRRSLKIQQEIGDKYGQSITLENISSICAAKCNYDKALECLMRALMIRQEIGDKSGVCSTLFDIGHIYMKKDNIREAVLAWVRSYWFAKELNLSEVIEALKSIAGQIGLPGGINGWEQILQQIKENG